MLSRAPLRTVKDRVRDSKHWDRYKPRPGDVVVATMPKAGTTWTQRIVSLLIFQSATPVPIMQIHPWVDCRHQIPIDVMISMLEAQTHRRSMKSHLPFDALPIYDEVKYIHTARGGLDACFSFHNHFLNFTPQAIGGIQRIAEQDGHTGGPPPPPPEDPREFFLSWMKLQNDDVVPGADAFFDIERSYWTERQRGVRSGVRVDKNLNSFEVPTGAQVVHADLSSTADPTSRFAPRAVVRPMGWRTAVASRGPCRGVGAAAHAADKQRQRTGNWPGKRSSMYCRHRPSRTQPGTCCARTRNR